MNKSYSVSMRYNNHASNTYVMAWFCWVDANCVNSSRQYKKSSSISNVISCSRSEKSLKLYTPCAKYNHISVYGSQWIFRGIHLTIIFDQIKSKVECRCLIIHAVFGKRGGVKENRINRSMELIVNLQCK